jgi:hypothetical protein
VVISSCLKFTTDSKFQNQLRRILLRSELLKKGQLFQDFAYSWSGRNRYIGTPGHNKTVNYIYDALLATGYYDVKFQEFTISTPINETVVVNGESIKTAAMAFSQAGDVTAPLGLVANLGCDAVSYSLPCIEKEHWLTISDRLS